MDDPYKYFRVEARELLDGLHRGVLDLENGIHDGELVAKLLRMAHTLKGAARVVKQPVIAEEAHLVEEALAPCRDTVETVSRGWAEEVLRHLDIVAGRLHTLDAPGDVRAQPVSAPAVEEGFTTVRVDVAVLDDLLDGLAEGCARLTALRHEVGTLANAGRLADELVVAAELAQGGGDGVSFGHRTRRLVADELRASLEHTERESVARLEDGHEQLLHVRNTVSGLRLVPAAGIFGVLQRAVRDAAQSVGVRVDFEARGAEVRIDPHVLTMLRDALLHVVRNAVAHGIEPESERRAAGKPAAGCVHLQVERRGSRVVFRCEDDGRGVDVEAVRRAAVDRRLLSAPAAERLGADEVVALIFQAGMTTRAAANEVAGRGVGLDVLGRTVAALKGDVVVRTERGRGTAVEVCVPISLSLLSALSVEAGGIALLPLHAVRETLHVSDEDLARSASGDRMVYDGEPIPFLPLAPMLGRRPVARDPGRPWTVVVVEAGAARAAIGVERLVGVADVVARPLPSMAPADPLVACVSIDAEGMPQLLLDPVVLVEEAARGRSVVAEAPEAPRRPVLVVDDSLTTRMLEKSILESAGYEVDLASSAEEAMAQARRRRYGVFVVDVEMPGMDGYEFVSRTRADPELRDVPAILVTSRGSADDRRRGAEEGASGYIVKGEFDQQYLLERIRSLTG